MATMLLAGAPFGCAREEAKGSSAETPKVSPTALNSDPILFDFVLYATNSIELQASTGVSGGDIGVEPTGTGSFLFPGFELAVHEQARIEATHSLLGGSVWLGAGAVVGDVQSNQLVDDGATHGALGAMPDMPEFPSAAATMPAPTFLFVPSGTTQQLDGGANFGLVLVADGSTLRLSGGTYEAGTLWLAASSRVEALAPSEVHIAGMLSSGERSFIGVAPDSTLDARNFRIEVSGTNGVDNLPATMPGAVRFEANDEIRALILAPNGTVRVAAGSRVTGAIFARDIEVGQGATVIFEGGFGVPTCRSDCDDANPCTIDGCVDGVCSHIAAPDGVACDDGSACTQSDSCQAGACVGSSVVTCAAIDQCHENGVCDPASGICSTPTKVNGALCDDGDACTQFDLCSEGACLGSLPVLCTASDACHLPGSCGPATGQCSNPAAAAGGACPDADACNGAETCDGNGACVPGPPPDIDDHNPCTSDTCDAVAGVVHRPVGEGTSCADNDVCNGAEACDANGSCRSGAPLLVDDQNLCTLDTCDPVNGVAHVAVAPGTSCADGNVCNGDEVCDADGVCLPGISLALDDANPCTADGCDAQTGATHAPLAAGSSCRDSNACNGNEICDGNGGCVAGPPAAIDDGDPCTLDTCDLVAGIVHHACSAIDRTVSSNIFDTTSFLYSGEGAVQKGAAPSAIEAPRAAVIRGRVLCCEGTPLLGVDVTVLGHPELGTTKTANDGRFDFAVNGGQPLSVSFSFPGYLPAQRRVQVPWQDFVSVADVALTTPDAQASSVDLSAPGIQVARASASVDASGVRQATLLFSEGTVATLTRPDQSTSTLTTLHVRLTEYSVGPLGLRFVPADLPPASAYTYAFELGADEATPGSSLGLSQPAAVYLENFLAFPVGQAIPVGSFDRSKNAWIPAENGRVIGIVSVTGGAADVDVDGNGVADTGAALVALGIGDAERQSLAALYVAGQSLWRLRVQRFTSWSADWGASAPSDAAAPNAGAPLGDDGTGPGVCAVEGSDIEPRRQVLGKSVPVAGTPFDLHYASDRVTGRKAAYALTIPLSGASVPASLRQIQLEISIAGRRFAQVFPSSPSQTTAFVWDGRDVYGRLMQGGQPVRVRVGYTYDGTYQEVKRFGDGANGVAIPGSTTREPITLWRDWTGSLGSWDEAPVGIGGWSLSVHHVLDPRGRVVYLGDGELRSGSDIPLSSAIVTAAGTGDTFLSGSGGPATAATVYAPSSVAVGSDGSFYIAETNSRVVRRVGPDGIIRDFAGGGPNFPGDGGLATQARLAFPLSVVVGRDGSVYIGDGNESFAGPRIRKVDPNGVITTVAGNGVASHAGDDGPATAASIGEPLGLAIGPDDSLYIAEGNLNRIRRVSPDGIITTMAGSGDNRGNFNEGGRAIAASINTATGVAVASDGTVFLSDRFDNVVRAVTTDGVIRTIAGDAVAFSAGFAGDGGPARLAKLIGPTAVALGPDGTIYIADAGNQRVRAVATDGVITTVAGNGLAGFSGEGGAAAAAALQTPMGITVEPTGGVLFADFSNNRVRRVTSLVPGFSTSDSLVASEDGRELYVFDGRGRHRQTVDTLTKAIRYQFGYDASGKLAAVTDADDHSTIVERDVNGNPVGITGPFGLRTPLSVDDNGYLLTVTNPAGDAYRLTHSSDGLLGTLSDPDGGLYQFGYDADGRLHQASDPAGGSTTLIRSFLADGYDVDRITALGRSTSYETGFVLAGGLRTTTTLPSGFATSLSATPAAVSTTALADGTTVTRALAPDPRFRMFSPIGTTTTRTPSGLTRIAAIARTATPTTGDPLGYSTFTETTSRNGSTWEQRFDVPTRTSTMTSPAGRKTFATFDGKGHATSTQTDGLLATANTYDEAGRLSTITRGTRSQILTYGDDGMLRSITDALAQTTVLERDAAGRVIRRTLPGDHVIGWGYDRNGNVTSIGPPGRPDHGFRYTPVDLLKGYDPPLVSGVDAPGTDYGYDLDHLLTDIFRPDGANVHQGYDAVGRLASVVMPTGTISYRYSATTGQLGSLSGPYGEDLSFDFDGFLATDVTYSNLLSANVHWTYDAQFRICLETLDGAPASCASPVAGSVAFSYDADDLLTGAGSLTLARDPRTGLLSGTTLGSVGDSTTYSAYGEVATYAAAFQSASLLSESYDTADGKGERDALGRIVRKTETVQGNAHTYGYGYDPRGRLVDVSVDGSAAAHYDYDANGNRLSKTSTGNTVAGGYDEQDRLLTYGAVHYAYGANGELASRTDDTTGATTRYTYDAAGNLIAVDLPGGRSIQYIADGLGRRVGKRVGGALVQGFLYGDAQRMLAATDGAGTVVSRFVYGSRAQVPEYVIMGGDLYRLIVDQVGSVRLVVNAVTGAVAQRIDYDEFGVVTGDSNPGFQPFGFGGGLYDPDTGLTRFGARDYEAGVGRWTAKDPNRFAGGDANLYEYVGGDPINR
jgi:RHS repeat-associated protein